MGRFDIRERYGAKFTLLLVVTTILVGGVGMAIYYTVDTELTENTERQLESGAASDATQLNNWLRLTEHQFVGVTRSTAVRSGNSYAAYDQLARVSGQSEIVGTSLVRLANGTVTVETGRVDLTDGTDQLRPAIAARTTRLSDSDQRTSYSEPFRLDGRPVVVAVTTTPSNDGRGLVSVIDLSKLSHELFDTTTDHDKTTTILTETGTVVLSSNRSALLTDSSVTGDNLRNASGVTSHTDGQHLTIGYADTDVADWRMTNQLSTAEAYSLRNTVSKQILLLLGVLVAGLGGIGLTIGRNTVQSVTELAQRAKTLQAGDLETPIESDRRDEFGDVFDALDAMRCSLREEIAEAEAAHQQADAERERAQTARQEATALNDRLESTAAEFGATMDSCADGDLSQRLSTDTDSDAMAEIAMAFNAMVDEWASTIQQARAFGDAVERETASVTERVDAAHDTSETLADGMASIADEATGQSTDLRTVRDETEQLSASVEEASSATTQIATAADEVLANGEAGREAARAARDELDAIENRTATAAQQVDQLAELVDDIEAVTDVISTIAEQTNILALNASIEAANADSDGFGAVAEEVKGLVEETQSATRDIESTIAELKAQTDTTADEMASARRKVEAGTETIDEALGAFDTIVDDIDETAAGISEIDRAIAQQAESTEAVMSELVTVSEVSTETATAAEAAATDAQQQANRMQAVSGRVDSLSTEASQLGALLDSFQTTTDAADELVSEDTSDQQSVVADDGDQSTIADRADETPPVTSSWSVARTDSAEAATDGGSTGSDER
jgi:methyl-accepting chemotaxis protein